MRMSRNLTQIQVIEKMQLLGSSMSRSPLANIEAGRRNIKASDLKIMRQILKVDYKEFFEDNKILNSKEKSKTGEIIMHIMRFKISPVLHCSASLESGI